MITERKVKSESGHDEYQVAFSSTILAPTLRYAIAVMIGIHAQCKNAPDLVTFGRAAFFRLELVRLEPQYVQTRRSMPDQIYLKMTRVVV